MELSTNPPTAAWETFTATHPAGHLLQSAGWAAFKAAWGWQPWRLLLCDAGQPRAAALVLFRRLPLGRSIAYIPRGPVAAPDDGAALAALWSAIHAEARRRGAIFLTVEPNWAEAMPDTARRLAPWGFQPSASHIQPPATILLDLRPEPDAILAQMKQKWRYNIRLAARKGVTVRVGAAADFAVYGALMAETGERDGFGVRPADYYRDAWQHFQPHGSRLLIAEFEGAPLAALVAFRHGHTAWYLYGASSNRERNRMPNHLLQWTAMLWAREAGASRYDFWGIPPEVPPDRELAEEEYGSGGLWGVFRFKQGFGGQIVHYPGAFDYVYSRPLFWAAQQAIARRGGLG